MCGRLARVQQVSSLFLFSYQLQLLELPQAKKNISKINDCNLAQCVFCYSLVIFLHLYFADIG